MGDQLPTPDQFRLDTLAEIEKAKLQRRACLRAADMYEDEVEALVAISVQLGIDTLPVCDAPPVLVQIARAELASAFVHVRRAARCAVHIGLPTDRLGDALAAISEIGKKLPRRQR